MELAEIRAAIDALDDQIVDIIAQRQRLVEAAGRRKVNAAAVPAPERVAQVIGRVRARARESGAEPDVVEATYRAMIGAFVELERRHVNHWSQGGDPDRHCSTD